MQSFFCALFIFIGVSGVVCAPYGPEGKALAFTQPEGTKLELRVFGDEFYARTETLDGYTVVFDPVAKTYFYALLSADRKRLEPTKLKVGIDNPEKLLLPKHVQLDPEAISEQARAAQERWQSGTRIDQRWIDLKESRRKAEITNTGVTVPSGTNGGRGLVPSVKNPQTSSHETARD